MVYGGLVEHFVEAVFNSPTLAECYKTAALDGLNRLDSWQTAPGSFPAPGEVVT
jgi:NAD(P) transhydrogenase